MKLPFGAPVLMWRLWSGLHLQVGYTRQGSIDQLWAGFSLAWWGLEARASSVALGDRSPRGTAAAGANRAAFDNTHIGLHMARQSVGVLAHPGGAADRCGVGRKSASGIGRFVL
ncbi:MAG: hypothetical protein R3C68_11815 [Myxococcota bacterium]